MKNISIFLINIIFLIGLISAVYPGEKIVVNNTLMENDLIYSISGNSTSINGLLINITNENIEISIPFDIQPTDFIITFYHEKNEQEVIVNSGSSNYKSSKIEIYQYNQSFCIKDKKMCSGDFVYFCDGNSWVLNEKCDYGCKDDKCLESLKENKKSEPEKQNLDKESSIHWIIMLISGILLILSFLILYLIKKRKKDNVKN